MLKGFFDYDYATRSMVLNMRISALNGKLELIVDDLISQYFQHYTFDFILSVTSRHPTAVAG